MSDKKIVGEAKRKADREAARKIASNVVTEGFHIGESSRVTSKPNKPKKPTAEQLGVSAVVGNRGKVRSENPVDAKPFSTKQDIQDDLNEYWKEATSHHSAEGYSLVKEIERRLGKEWWSLANKGETLPALIARAIKHLATPQPTQTVVVVESKPVQQTIAPRAVETPKQAVVKPAAVTASKPRGEGPSNKEICYKEWLKTPVADIPKLIALVPAVKDTTVKQWVKKWEQNDPNWLPACAKSGDFPTSMRSKK